MTAGLTHPLPVHLSTLPFLGDTPIPSSSISLTSTSLCLLPISSIIPVRAPGNEVPCSVASGLSSPITRNGEASSSTLLSLWPESAETLMVEEGRPKDSGEGKELRVWNIVFLGVTSDDGSNAILLDDATGASSRFALPVMTSLVRRFVTP